MKKRKKILLLSDDIRMNSGVARMSREFVVGTCEKYDWVQIAGAVKHPEEGKRIDVKSDPKFPLPKSAKIVLYPTTGYGNESMLRSIMDIEKPDAILHFTDPRFWVWLYNMEHEIRQNIPIMYYNIWDDLPDPLYNRNYYRSSDLLMGISKQTYGINKRLLPEYEDWQLKYIPHGVNEERLHIVSDEDLDFLKFQTKAGIKDYKFKVLYLNRNIRRKNPGDVALAFKHFVDRLPDDEKSQCCLIYHTAPVDEHGTDLKAVCDAVIPARKGYHVIFTHEYLGHIDDKDL